MTTIENDNKKMLIEEEEIKILNKFFAKCYTNEDEEYIRMVNASSTSPPIVDDWGQINQRRYYANNRYNKNFSRRDRSRSPPSYHYNKRR